MTTPVTVGWLHGDYGDRIAHSFHESFLQLLAYDLNHGNRVWRGGWIPTYVKSGGITEARNDTISEFLRGDSEWFCWFDTDMGFGPDTISRLLEVADPVRAPIVGALCFMWVTVGSDGMGGFRHVPGPTIYDWTERDAAGLPGLLVRTSYEPDTLTECDATGSACVVIHRSVFETVGSGWYDRQENPPGFLSEDLSFCLRAKAAGFPTHVHTGVKTTHAKTIWVSEDDWEAAC